MKHLIPLFAVLFALLTPSLALAEGCAQGDLEMGPNCVHVEEWEVGSAAGHGPLWESTVYRMDGDTKKVVWKGLGEIKESTEDNLKTEVRFEYDSGEVQVITSDYPWMNDLQSYKPYR